MDDFEKCQPQMTVQVANPISEGKSAMSELLEDSGNCLQSINLHLLSDSLFSEQQKLSHVLDWAHSFLSSGSDVHHVVCRSDSLILASEDQREAHRGSQINKPSSAAKYHHQATCTADSYEVFGGAQRMEKMCQPKPGIYKRSDLNSQPCEYKLSFSDDPCIPFCFTSKRDEVTWPEKTETPVVDQHDTAHKQSLDNNCRTSSLYVSTERHRKKNHTLSSSGKYISSVSDGNHSGKEQRDKMRANVEQNMGPKMEAEEDKTEAAWTEVREVQINNEQESSLGFMKDGRDNKSHSTTGQTLKQMEKTANPNFSCPLKIPANITVYEQYQRCVDSLRMRGSQQKSPCCETDSFDTNAYIKKSKVSIKGVAAVDFTKTFLPIMNRNQDRNTSKNNWSTLSEHGYFKTPVKETPAAIYADSRPVCERKTVSTTYMDLDSNKHDFIKRAKNSKDIKTQTEQLWTTPIYNVSPAEESDAFTTSSGMKYLIFKCLKATYNV